MWDDNWKIMIAKECLKHARTGTPQKRAKSGCSGDDAAVRNIVIKRRSFSGFVDLIGFSNPVRSFLFAVYF